MLMYTFDKKCTILCIITNEFRAIDKEHRFSKFDKDNIFVSFSEDNLREAKNCGSQKQITNFFLSVGKTVFLFLYVDCIV